jgi:hypothetical protein
MLNDSWAGWNPTRVVVPIEEEESSGFKANNLRVPFQIKRIESIVSRTLGEITEVSFYWKYLLESISCLGPLRVLPVNVYV